METIEALPTTNIKSFSKHMLSFNDSDKGELFNLLQYGFLCIIPIVSLNKLIQYFIPEVDEDKGSIEIMIEVITQMSMLLVGMFIIHRLVTFVPTYSGVGYNDMHIVNNVLAFLVIVLSLQTRLGEKVNLLVVRMRETVGKMLGYSYDEEEPQQKETQMENEPTHQQTQADNVGNYGVRQAIEQPSVSFPDQRQPVMANSQNYNTPNVGDSMQQHQATPDFGAMHDTFMPTSGGFSSSFSPF